MEYSNDPLGYGNVIFHHIPNKNAPSFQAAMLVFAFCLGIMALELLSNVQYDWSLARRKGWLEPTKGSNRVAYFMSRFFAALFLIITLVFMTTTGLPCSQYATFINVVCIVPLVSVDFIFMQRTVAIFGWNRAMSVLLYGLFIVDMGLAIASVTWFGYGYRIPSSNYCAYFTRTSGEPHASLFIAYCAVLIFLDTLILVLTCHRMLDKGLMGVPQAIKRQLTASRHKRRTSKTGGGLAPSDSISALLIRQGLHYYFFLEASRLAFLIVYYSVSGETSYQVMITALLVTVGPVLAGRLFRETSDFVRRTTARSNRTDDDHHTHGRGTAGRGDEELHHLTQHTNVLPLVSPLTPHTFDFEDEERQEKNDGSSMAAAQNAGLRIFVEEKQTTSSYPTPRGLLRTPSTSNTLIEQRPFFDSLPPMSPAASPMWRTRHNSGWSSPPDNR